MEEIHQESIIYLYRLLFILYAESRNILPVHNYEYVRNYSLQEIQEKISRKTELPVSNTTIYWSRLKRLFDIVEGRYPELNKVTEIPKYSGYLFLTDKHPFLEKYCLSDKTLVTVIKDISQKPDGTLIDYSNIQIDHLGSIFEILLKYRLRLEDEKYIKVRKGRSLVWIPGSEKTSFIKIIEEVEPGNVFFDDYNRNRRNSGSFYTPATIISYMNRTSLAVLFKKLREKTADNGALDTVAYINSLLNLRILDPATGGGHFLIDVAKQLASELVRVDKDSNSDELSYYRYLKAVFDNCIYGVDLNPLAVELARLAAWLTVAPLKQPLLYLGCRLKAGNSLISYSKREFSNQLGEETGREDAFRSVKGINGIPGTGKPFRWENEFPQIFNRENDPGFDLIVGNPPYLSFGSGRTSKIPETMEKYIRKSYPNSAEYKISYYALFIEKSVSLLRRGGVLSFILPDSYLTGRYFSKIRNFLLTRTTIDQFVIFSRNFWKEVDAGFPTIITLRNEKCSDDHQIEYFNPAGPGDLNDGLERFRVFQGSFRQLPRQRFRFIPDNTGVEIIEKMEKAPRKLGDFLEFHHGIRSRTGVGRKIIVCKVEPENRSSGDNWKLGLVSSGEIRQFIIMPKGNFLNVNPGLLFSGGWNPAHIEQPKLLIRRTGDRLIAALDRESYYHTNALIYAITKPDSGENKSLRQLQFYLAVLNSITLQYYYEKTSMKKGRSLPQVEIDILEQLPVCKQFDPEDSVETSCGIFSDLNWQEINEKILKLSDSQIFDLVCNLSVEITNLRKKLSMLGDDSYTMDKSKNDLSPFGDLKTRINGLRNSLLEKKKLLDSVVCYRIYGLDISDFKVIESSIKPVIY
ncbi:MAG: Eco57I restriction-modification methylase domain-containing protein [Candidatus Odinarchaeota archaeon]